MSKVNKVLAKYGLGMQHQLSEEHLQRNLKRVFRDFEIKYPRTNEQLKKEILRAYTHQTVQIIIADNKVFGSLLEREGIELPFQDWKMELLYFGLDPKTRETQLKFQFRKHSVKRIIKERIEKQQTEMMQEFPSLAELLLKNLFEDEVSVDPIKKTVRKQVVNFAEEINRTNIIQNIQKELLQAMWQEYQDARETIITKEQSKEK